MVQVSLIEIGKKYNLDVVCKTECTYAQYERHLSSLRNEKLCILELGVYTGASLAVWEEYFPNATIVGLDINGLDRKYGDRVHFVKGSQSNTDLLTEISEKFAPHGWDIIIDDASHVASLTKVSFDHLFINHLKAGGLYFIEDWGTGYWDDWVDGMEFIRTDQDHDTERVKSDGTPAPSRFPSHDYGMVGLIKQLVDEAGMDSIKKRSTDQAIRPTRINYMEVNFAFAMVKKIG